MTGLSVARIRWRLALKRNATISTLLSLGHESNDNVLYFRGGEGREGLLPPRMIPSGPFNLYQGLALVDAPFQEELWDSGG